MTSGPLRRILALARRAADPTDDAGLLARFADSADADAFELLVWRHGGMVLSVCRRILGDAHAAEDAFQATFLALARRAGSVRRGGCAASWLHRVASRVAIRARQSDIRRSRHERRAAAMVRSEPSPPSDELRAVLDEELDRLPERFRRAVVLCYLEGRSTAEAAHQLGCARGTILSRLATARAKLKGRLVRRGVVPAAGGLAAWSASANASAALLVPTVRAVIANTATPRVIDLCDGVLRAMILYKLKLTTAAVLTVGVIGGGYGWMALAPGGPGVALAGGQAKAGTPRAEPDPEQFPPARTPNQDDAKKVAEINNDTREKFRVANEKAAAQAADFAYPGAKKLDERAGNAGVTLAGSIYQSLYTTPDDLSKVAKWYDKKLAGLAGRQPGAVDVGPDGTRRAVYQDGEQLHLEALAKRPVSTRSYLVRAKSYTISVVLSRPPGEALTVILLIYAPE